MPRKPTIDVKTLFLAAYVKYPNLTRAAKTCGIDRSNHYQWSRDDPEYPARYAQARIEAGQTVLDRAVDWVMEGIEEPIIYQGQFQYKQKPVTLCLLPDGREIDEKKLPKDVGEVRIKSRRIVFVPFGKPLKVRRMPEGTMLRLLGGFLPEMFRASKVELTGKDGGPIEIVERLNAARKRLARE